MAKKPQTAPENVPEIVPVPEIVTEKAEVQLPPLPVLPMFSREKAQVRDLGRVYLLQLTDVPPTAGYRARSRFLALSGHMTPWKCQGAKFRTEAEARSFADGYEIPHLLTVVLWSDGWHESLPEKTWRNTRQLAQKAPQAGGAEKAA